MTIYCYRDGILASDSGIFANGVCHGRGKKAYKTSKGVIHACSGRSSNAQMYHVWMEELASCQRDLTGTRPTLDEDFSGHFIEPNGNIFYVDRHLVPVPIDAPFIAGGYASDLAIGAMARGASAIEAVEIALLYSDCVRGPLQYVTLEGIIP